MSIIKRFTLHYDPKFSKNKIVLESGQKENDQFPDKIDERNYWMGNDGRIRGQFKVWGNGEGRIGKNPLEVKPSINPIPKLTIGPVVTFSKDNVSDIIYI